MNNLVVPGVSVEARYDVLPPLPAPSGILGAVGIVDRRPPDGRTVGVTQITELRDLLGPGTEHTMPDVSQALANGAREVVVAAVAGGSPSKATLDNADGKATVLLRCRSNGTWGNDLRVEVRALTNAAGAAVRVNLIFSSGDRVLERFSDLVVSPGVPGDLVSTLNAGSRLVVASDAGAANAKAAPADYVIAADESTVDVPAVAAAGPKVLQIVRAPGGEPGRLRVKIAAVGDRLNVEVHDDELRETFNDVTLDADDARYLPHVVQAESRLIRAHPLSTLAKDERIPASTIGRKQFAGGSSPSVQQYRDAVGRLADDPRIDLVLASVEPGRSDADVAQIHQALQAHAVAMADAGAPRIAFGAVTAAEASDLDKIRDHAAAVRHRQFVLVAPPGAAGAVAGMVGRLPVHHAPTFKPVPLHGTAPSRYRESELNRLLGPSTNLLVVQNRAGRGVVVLKGIDTTGDQISVTRVAHKAIRETKAIAEGFIGRLNTDEARSALRQQVVSAFLRMERDNALVPSVDGEDPAFHVNVYSTQDDFAKGIVRIDIAVRPVRAIDYVYATIRVKN